MASNEKDVFSGFEKGLSICFIIGILVVNAGLILKNVRKNRFIYHPKNLTFISLAIGDIFLAAFSLVIMPMTQFDHWSDSGPSCSTRVLAKVYQQCLLPFVYGVGLIVLAVEVLMRQRTLSGPGNANKSVVKAILFSALPWLLGLIIVLPITLAGMDWDVCWRTTDDISQLHYRFIFQYVVSVLLPALGTLITSIVAVCKKPPVQPDQEIILGPTAMSDALSPCTEIYDTNDSATNKAPGYSQYPQQTPAETGYYPQQTPGYTQEFQQDSDQCPQYAPKANYPVPPYPAQPDFPDQPDDYAPTLDGISQQPPINLTPDFTELSKYKKYLLCTSILYCICVIPYTGFAGP